MATEITCSFCEKGRSEVRQMVAGPTFSGETIYICNECVDFSHSVIHDKQHVASHKDDEPEQAEKIYTPSEIKAHLDKYVIGQDSAKAAISIAVYNHYKRINNVSDIELEKSNLLLLGPSGSGKAQPLYAKIKVPGGWTTMGEIQEGDVVSTPDGKSAVVVGLFPQGKKDIYRITFVDGRTAECCDEHLWEVYSDNWKSKWKIKSLSDIMKSVQFNHKNGVKIRLSKPAETPDIELPVDPYVLGVLIGDGCMRHGSVSFSTADSFILDKMATLLTEGCTIRHKNNYDYTILSNTSASRYSGDTHPYKIKLKELGLYGKLSYDKFIPQRYKESSTKQKLKLLQGLLDADGYCRSGSISFSTSSEKLAKDVQELIWSIGGIAKINGSTPTYTYDGNRKSGAMSYTVSIRYHSPHELVSLPRKQEKVQTYQYKDRLKLAITSVDYVGKLDAQCIMIDHPEHLYITDDYVVTHNTLIVKTIAKLFDLPCVIADATSLTEAGYVGEDVESLVEQLLEKSGGDVEKAQRGIVFIDEIDKISRKGKSNSVSRDVSGEGVQQALLKLVEGTDVKIQKRSLMGETIDFDTTNVLFVASGAFIGLEDVIKKRCTTTSIGIHAEIQDKNKDKALLSEVTPEDIIEYGIIPEFIGRFPVVAVLGELTEEMLVKILSEPKNSLVTQFKYMFALDGVDLELDDKYVSAIAKTSLDRKTGARGLRSLLEKTLQSTQFNLPDLSKQGVVKVVVDGNGNATYIFKKRKKQVNKDE